MDTAEHATTKYDELVHMWHTIHEDYEIVTFDDPQAFLGDIVPYTPGLMALLAEAEEACQRFIYGDEGPDGQFSGPGRYADAPDESHLGPQEAERIRSTHSLLRAFRDALWAAARERLTRTAFTYELAPDHGLEGLIEAGKRLSDDYLNLSNVYPLLSEIAGREGDWNSWEANAKVHTAMRSIADRIGRIQAEGKAPGGQSSTVEPAPCEIQRIQEELDEAAASLQVAREGLLKVVDRDFLLSLRDLAPSWAGSESRFPLHLVHEPRTPVD